MGVCDQDCFVTSFECAARLNKLSEAVNFAKRYFENVLGRDADPLLLFNLELVVSEACTNVIKYAYPDGHPGSLHLDLGHASGRLVIRIRDNGAPFDPCKIPEPDLDNPKDSGLGIFFVRELMDIMEYCRAEGENVLVLAKSVQAPCRP